LDLKLEGKKAIVSGGSRGIGKAIALQLAREGCDVAIGARNEGPLKETVDEIAKATGRKIAGFTVNTLDVGSIKAFVKQSADALGGVDIVINSAARVGGAAGDIEAIDEGEILRDFEEKTIGYLRVAREAIPYMKQNGWGRIINISGLAGRRPEHHGRSTQKGDRRVIASEARPHGGGHRLCGCLPLFAPRHRHHGRGDRRQRRR
jgi:NAD(P)-dependent dehydrogenase (short-subunit alcohol dehydrogenase family)